MIAGMSFPVSVENTISGSAAVIHPQYDVGGHDAGRDESEKEYWMEQWCFTPLSD